jgi:hypothetical protein
MIIDWEAFLNHLKSTVTQKLSSINDGRRGNGGKKTFHSSVKVKVDDGGKEMILINCVICMLICHSGCFFCWVYTVPAEMNEEVSAFFVGSFFARIVVSSE